MFLPIVVSAQHLTPLITYSTFPEALTFDRADSILYVGVSPCVVDTLPVPGLAQYDGTQWSAVPNAMDSFECNFVHWIQSDAYYQGQLFIAGNFYHAGGLGPESRGVARWDGSTWHGDGGIKTAPKLLQFDDELWLGGIFDSIGNNAISALARWDGSGWQPFGAYIPNTTNIDEVRAVARYQGALIIGGNLTGMPIAQDVLEWSGSDWQQLGNGLHGAANGFINAMAEFGGLLYVGGAYWTSDGAPSQNIVIWDGINWLPFMPGIVVATTQVLDMKVIDNKLYIAGSFHFTGDNNKYYHLLQYDGTHLCAVGSLPTFAGNQTALEVTGNSAEVYFSDYATVLGSDTVNLFAHWVLADGADTCVQVIAGVSENTNMAHAEIYPNPANTILNIDDMGPSVRSVEVLNILGQPVLQTTYTRNAPVNVSALAVGTYTLRLFDARGVPVAMGRFVKE